MLALSQIFVLVYIRSQAFAGRGWEVVTVTIKSAVVDTVVGVATSCALKDPVIIVIVYCDMSTIVVEFGLLMRPEKLDVWPEVIGFFIFSTINYNIVSESIE